VKTIIVALFLLLSFHAGLFAQATTQLSGVVTDPTGAVVPGASLELENLGTGLKRTAASDAAGAYSFVQVVPGEYKLTASVAGFRSTTIHGLRLLVNNPATVPVRLEVGQVTESVSVTAETLMVNTTDASIGNAIGTKPIVQLPLNARNIVGLLALQPGVVYTKENDTTGESDTDSRNGAVNGGKSDQANVTLDGVDVNDQMDRQAFRSVLRMTPDSVQEFRVTTMNANADAGRSSGAQVVLVTKSGTNEMHGSLYEYHRNTVTTANGFFQNSSGLERPKLIRNIFGASAGGPIVRNKLFVFGNFEGRRDARDGSAVRDVPSMNMRQGILQYQRRDGTTATVTPADLAAKLDPRGVNQAVLKLLQSYPAPNDDTRGDGLNIVGYRFNAPLPLRWNTYIGKIDWNIDEAGKHQAFLRGNLQNDRANSLPQFPGQEPSKTLRNNKGLGAGLTSVLTPSLISTFRYGLTRQGWEQTGISNVSPVTLRGLSSPFGLTRGFAAIIPVHSFSEDVSWTRGAHLLQFGGVIRLIQNKRTDSQNAYSSAVSNASWLINSGAELNAPFPDADNSGVLFFRYAASNVLGLVTQGNAQYNYRVDGSVIGEGNPVLRNFAAEEYEMYIQDTWKATRALTVTAGLRWTLAPPVYEKNGQQVSPDQRVGDWFNMRGGLAQQGRSQMEAGRLSFVPADQGGRPLYDYHKRNFAPRISLAYSPQGTDGLSKFFFGGPGRTSIRAGWGMYYDLFGSGLMRTYDATAFGLSTALTNPSAVLSVATAPRFTAFDQIPQQVLLPPPPAKFPAVYPDAFAITRAIDDTIVPPYSMAANFSIGREFNGGWFVQGSYVGRFSRRSLVRRDAAMPTDLKDPKSGQTYFEAATILARQAVDGVPVANVQNVPFWENMFSKTATPTMTATQKAYSRFAANVWDWTYALYQMDTPGCVAGNRCSDQGPWTFFHPQFSYLSVFSSVGHGNYHGTQWNVRKRFSNGDTLDANYTFSKSTDLRSFTERETYATGVIWNPWQPGLHKGVSDYDNTHLFNMHGVYSLPVGRQQRFLSGAPGWLNAIVGGWQLSGVWRMASGFPVSVYSTGVWPTNWNNNNWALWNGEQFAVGQTKNAPAVTGRGGPNMFPDPKAALEAFGPEMPGGIGTRNPVRGDGVFGIDGGLAKRFSMPWEGHSLQFRWEVFNLTNTARFDVSDMSLDIGTPGTFGKYTSTLSNPRVMQFGLRYEF
jgi:hypothetical protein